MCGQSTPESIYYSESNNITINFVSGTLNPTDYSGFKLRWQAVESPEGNITQKCLLPYSPVAIKYITIVLLSQVIAILL